jgi:CRISPR/Cas system-associated protein Cas5 (RAMP superfamily)
MIFKRLIIFAGIVFTVASCTKLKGPDKPKNLISKGKMIDILIDAKLITSASSANKIIMRDSSLNINTYIYEKHNVDSLQFALSNSYYAFHIEEYEDIYTRLTDSLEKLKSKLKEIEAEEWKAQTKREADSLEEVLKKKELLKPENKDAAKIEDVFLEESIEELKDLIEPISDTDFQ